MFEKRKITSEVSRWLAKKTRFSRLRGISDSHCLTSNAVSGMCFYMRKPKSPFASPDICCRIRALTFSLLKARAGAQYSAFRLLPSHDQSLSPSFCLTFAFASIPLNQTRAPKVVSLKKKLSYIFKLSAVKQGAKIWNYKYCTSDLLTTAEQHLKQVDDEHQKLRNLTTSNVHGRLKLSQVL